MVKVGQRAVIECHSLKGLTSRQLHENMVSTLRDPAPLYATVKKWAAEFRRGVDLLEKDPRSGSPVTVTTEEMVGKVHDIIMADRTGTTDHIVNELGTSREHVQAIIHNELQMSKRPTCWVPKLLGPEQKRVRYHMSKDNIAMFEADGGEFLQIIVTVDEAWARHYQPGMKIQSKQWKHPDSPMPKKARKVKSAGKVMATVPWDAGGVLLVDFSEKGRTITG